MPNNTGFRPPDARRLCPPPHTPKAVTYHEQSHYCRFVIGHSLGRMDISFFLPHFRLHEVVSLHMCFLPCKYRNTLKMLLTLMKLCAITCCLQALNLWPSIMDGSKGTNTAAPLFSMSYILCPIFFVLCSMSYFFPSCGNKLMGLMGLAVLGANVRQTCPIFFPHFRLYEVVSLCMRVLP